jgi:hypothetical protein
MYKNLAISGLVIMKIKEFQNDAAKGPEQSGDHRDGRQMIYIVIPGLTRDLVSRQ